MEQTTETELVDGTGAADWIQPIKTQRAFEEILDQLEQALLTGQLAAGGRLPPERDFAAALGVSRASVREAIRVMEALGLVDINRGPAGAVLRPEPRNAFAEILRLHLALGHYSWPSIIELRGILEGWAFAEAARRADESLLAELSELLTRMAEPAVDQTTFLELDLAFHSKVVSASDNPLLAGILEGCSAVIRKGMFEGITAGAWPETARRLIEDHRELYELVARGDADAASSSVREHIRRWDPRSAQASVPGDGETGRAATL
jgi:GntR family transcriptional regulator, transcriptional repressor for pyruvate dehydrogenase complex